MTRSQARESCKVQFQKKEPLVDMRLSVCLFVSPTDKLYASVRCGVPSEDESNGKRDEVDRNGCCQVRLCLCRLSWREIWGMTSGDAFTAGRA